MKLITRILLHNWPLKATSVGLAIVLWLYVLVRTNVWTVREVEVTVQTEGAAPGLQVMAIAPPKVKVRVAGRLRRVNRVDESMLRVAADVKGHSIGEYETAITVTTRASLPRGVRILPVQDQKVVVTLDETVEQKRAVQVVLRGRPAPGFQAVDQACRPNEVTISGPQTAVEATARAVAVVDVSGIDATRSFISRIEPRDARDMPQAGVAVDPAYATITIELARVNTRTVPVVVGGLDLPAGATVESIDLSPQVVTITGDPVVLARVGFVRTATVRLAPGATSVRADLRAPQGVAVVGETSVRVTIRLAEPRAPRAGRPSTGRSSEGPEAPGGGAEAPASPNSPAEPPLPAEAGTAPSPPRDGAPPGGGDAPPAAPQ